MGLLPAVLAALSLTATLNQVTTNGLSLLGTLSSDLLPKYLTDSPFPFGYPWGQRNCTNTNPYVDTQTPDTGITRTYNFTISRGILSPDGYEKQLILVNNQFPGPTIQANWGDTIIVNVRNNIFNPVEGTSIHWHGFLQHKTQWMDGTPGFTECPIAPGKSFTYKFRAELYGTTWYHAHYSSQYVDGVSGPIVIYGPNQQDYDMDIGPILLSDYYHTDYRSIVKDLVSPQPRPVKPVSDNNLINGKMNFICSNAADKTVKCANNAGVSKFRFHSKKLHRLRLINNGADATQQFSIDGHLLTVIENDFVAVEPYNTQVVTLGIGQRTDVLVRGLENASGIYWIRSNGTCAESKQPNAVAALYYENATSSALPTSTPISYPVGCDNDPLNKTVPLYSISPGEPDQTYTLNLTFGRDDAGVWLWLMNNSSFRADLSQPVLLQARDGNLTFPKQWNVINTGSSKSYRFIFNNRSPLSHPMHFHGHNMYVLAVGQGSWDGKTIIRPTNPQRRDVQNVPAGGYMVWQADANNPGAWAFHCHLAWHAATGLTMDILEHPNELRNLKTPDSVDQVCDDWNAIVAAGQIEQVDSGV